MDRRNDSLLELTEEFRAELVRQCPGVDENRAAAIAHYWLLQAYDAGNQERAELLMLLETQQKTVERLKKQQRRLLLRISRMR